LRAKAESLAVLNVASLGLNWLLAFVMDGVLCVTMPEMTLLKKKAAGCWYQI